MPLSLILAATLVTIGQPDCLAEARARYTEANVAYRATKLDRARDLYRESIEAFTSLGALPDLLQAYYGYLFVTPKSEELETYSRGIDLAQRLGNETLEGQLIHAHADHLYRRGEFSTAADLLEKAIGILERADANAALAPALVSLGRLHRAHGRADLALPLYERALAVQEHLGRNRDAVQTLNAMAVAHAALEQHEQTLARYERAMRMAVDLKSDQMINFLRGNIAGTFIVLGRHEDAIFLLRAVLNEPITPYLAAFRNRQLAEAYLAVGKHEEAAAPAEKAVELARSQGVESTLSALFVRARAMRKLGRQAEAMADIDESLRTVEELRAKLIPEDFMKRGFIDVHQRSFGLALELHSERGDHAEALQSAERARARSFLDLLATRQIDPLLQTARGDHALRSSVSVEAPGVEEIAEAARESGSTFLIYWINQDKTFIWVVDGTRRIQSRTVDVSSKRLGDLVKESWGRTDSTSSRGVVLRSGETMTIERMERKAWRELYRHLIAPVRELLPSKRGSLVTVIPHGPLFRLSFAGLLDEKDRYLVESYALHYAPAASVLRFIASRTDDRAPGGYLLISNPRFAPSGGRTLPPLPGSEREVKAIARLFPDEPLKTLNGGDASEKQLRESIENKAVVHFATHGIVRDDQTLDSFLALARGAGGKSDDGRLTAQEIYALHMNAELVVLSACRSGLGQVSGDGIAGLTRAFFYAGAQSVVATLWDVADEPTSALLRDFYRSLRGGAEKSRALRSAQLSMLRRLRAGQVKVETMAGPATLPEHPVFWASFVLQGKP